MKKHHLNTILVIFFISIISILYWKSILDVPFHPDEATQIFMSQDVDLFINGKGTDLFYSKTPTTPITQHYHLVDPPFTRYVIGLARLIFRDPGLANDWNWAFSWEINLKNGALPSQKQLLIARSSVFLFFPCSLILLFLIVNKINGKKAAWIAMLLYSFNSLILLHTHRAMTEGPLLFWLLLSIYLMIARPKNFFLTAIAIAFAINTKLTGVALLPVLVIQIFIFFPLLKTKIINVIISLGIIIGICIVLNPVYWKTPIIAFKDALQERSSLMASQKEGLSILNPEKVLSSPMEKVAAMVGNIYLQPPAISDLNNYDKDLERSKVIYLGNFIHTISQNFYFAVPFMVLSISGFFLLCLRLRSKTNRFQAISLLLCFIFQIATILIVADLPFQRYVIPVVPYSYIFTALFISSVFERKKPAQE